MKLLHFLSLFLTPLLLRTPQSSAVQVTNIRLMNGTNVSVRVGRVEIQVDNINTWGSICDDGWDNKEAIVVCRSLGFTNGGTATIDTRFGTGSFVFLMDDSACTGDESSLSECLSSQISDCKRGTDTEAGVECNANLGPGQATPTPATTTTSRPSVISGSCQTSPTVRLTGRQGVDGIGYVEVQQPVNGRWGYVCDDGWSSEAAKIVCAQMCFPTNYTAKPGIPAEFKPTLTNPTVILDDVHCIGNETTLQNCPHALWGVQDCLATDGELAGVQCVAAPYLPPPAPVPVLVCGQGKMIAQFSRAQDSNLEAKHLSVLSQPNCPDVTTNTSTQYVSIIIPVDKCGTRASRNGTHIIYYNEIKYDFTSQEGTSITRVNTYRVQISCILPVDVEVTQRVEPVTQAVTQTAVGNFPVQLTIYRNDSFTVPVTENPVQIPLGEYLNMVVSMEEYDPNLKLVVTDCVASPTGDILGNIRRILFANKCSQEDSLTFYPLSNFRFGFRFKPFRFVGYDILYIHCNAIICLASDNTQECDRTCANSKTNLTTTPASTGRKRRNTINIYSASAVSQAILICYSSGSCPNIGNSNDNKPDNTNISIVTGQPPTFPNSSTPQHVSTTSNLNVSSNPSLPEIVTTSTNYKETTTSNSRYDTETTTSNSRYDKETTKLQSLKPDTTVTNKSQELETGVPEPVIVGDNGSLTISLCPVLLFMLLASVFCV